MAQLASCPRCGLSVQVLDLGVGPPLCPSCAAPMDEVPDAEMVAEGPPTGPLPPLAAQWQGVARGLGWVRRGLQLFFAGWGLVLIAAFAVVVFRLADVEGAGELFPIVVFAGNVLFVAVDCVLAAGRRCCAVVTVEGLERRPAGQSALATALAGVLWLVLLVWTALWLPAVPPARWLAWGWLAALLLSRTGEFLFVVFLRDVGRCLGDRAVQDGAGWFLAGRGRQVLVGQTILAVIALASAVALEGREVTSLPVGLALLALVVLLGVAGTALAARELRVVSAARQAIESRLAPAAAPDEPPLPAKSP